MTDGMKLCEDEEVEIDKIIFCMLHHTSSPDAKRK